MVLEIQYPVFGYRSVGLDVRAKWFTSWYEEIRQRVPTRFVRLFYIPTSRATYWIYRQQLRLLERPTALTHIITQMESFLLRRRNKCPTVITCYDLSVPRTLEFLRYADRVIVPARQVKELLVEAVRLPHEPTVIPLAVPPAYRPADVPRVRDRVLNVGTEQARKNVEGLFRIFARVLREMPATLVKVGAASDARPRLVNLANELGISDHLVWKDFVSEDELLQLYHTSTVTVIPSFLEGFSMPCLEAMSCGCPLIASNLSAIPETVGAGGLTLDPKDEEAWADAILRVLRDPSVARDLSRRGIERSKAFSAEQSAARTLRVYEELSGQRSR